MATELVPFATALARGVRRIDNAREARADLGGALRYSCGVVEGYYLAGAITRPAYLDACGALRRAFHARLALLELKREAIKEGLA